MPAYLNDGAHSDDDPLWLKLAIVPLVVAVMILVML
jgi:hypothetical protein